MGWEFCGEDSTGRPIGYGVDAVCDHPECNETIHRGLAYACGGMHGDDEYSCERYFCDEHLMYSDLEGYHYRGWTMVCMACYKFNEINYPPKTAQISEE